MKRVTLLSLALGLITISSGMLLASPADAHPEHWGRFEQRNDYSFDRGFDRNYDRGFERGYVDPGYHPIVNRILWSLGL